MCFYIFLNSIAVRSEEVLTQHHPQSEYHSARPLILEEAFESPESTIIQYEEGYGVTSLGSGTGSPRLLHMSVPGKPQPHQLHGKLFSYLSILQHREKAKATT